ncbi:MAG: allantoicase [Myxococcota bacterium]|nr:allantoicase [Myxococcota bacterium]
MTNLNHVRGFNNLIELAAETMGGKVLACSDDFFASKDNLIKAGRGIFVPEKYTEHGKWMDGWESRRKRTPGHDWCILQLGLPGIVAVLDIDTNHFLGNHAPFTSVEGTWMPNCSDLKTLEEAKWSEVLPQSILQPGQPNQFLVPAPEKVSHLRLNIFPDGGVARLRAYGSVVPTGSRNPDTDTHQPHLQKGEVDLVALRSGGQAVICSDNFFSPMHHLIAPGKSKNMGGGWETKRKRTEGFDWVILETASPGKPTLVVVDTQHFIGNYPNTCSLEGAFIENTTLLGLCSPDITWSPILKPSKLQGNREHVFRDTLISGGPFTHLKLSIFPDGGISRLRVYGLDEDHCDA